MHFQVTPLTALKFAELTMKAGFPKGVINIIPGSGGVAGQRLSQHPDIRKLGFTGSTSVGKQIMKRYYVAVGSPFNPASPWNSTEHCGTWKSKAGTWLRW